MSASFFALMPHGLDWILIFGFFGVGLLGTIFWIVEIVACVTKESSEGNTKIVWLLIILFTHFLGAALYYFIRRPERIATLGR